MKLLLDSCVAQIAGQTLRAAGHDVEWVGDWSKDPGDLEILQHAVSQQRILITLDKDFGELAIVHGFAHCGLIRLTGFRAQRQGPALLRLRSSYVAELADGALVTAEPWRVRIRK
jgi:predicted nuclease of predicted toxin-antitoxin system